MAESRFLAFDLGAESSRAMVGTISEDSFEIEEIHRFPSRNVSVHGTKYWDILYIFAEIKEALAIYARKYGPELAGIGIDSWGVDFGILGESGHLLQNPVQYRDHRTDGILDKAFDVMPRETLYERTGIQFMQINTLYQLWALARNGPEVVREAHTFLMIPDLLHYFLCGVSRCEYTLASTTQLLDVHSKQWDTTILDTFGLPARIMPEIVQPGTVLGQLDAEVSKDAGLHPAPVITPCTHDTAAAVAATPAQGDKAWAYLSCGTWSLLGAELDEPRTSGKALEYNFTNEGGYGGKIRFLKNIMGLWVLQQCRAAWLRQGREYAYADLTQWARESSSNSVVLNIDDPSFLNPDDMLDAIAAQCARTGQQLPDEPGAVTSAVLEGLAIRYAVYVRQLEDIIEQEIEVLHMVGGGIRNQLLCQFTSDATGVPVIAGPAEATSMGNLAVQAIACETLPNHASARALIGKCASMQHYEPARQAEWQQLIERFHSIFG